MSLNDGMRDCRKRRKRGERKEEKFICWSNGEEESFAGRIRMKMKSGRRKPTNKNKMQNEEKERTR